MNFIIYFARMILLITTCFMLTACGTPKAVKQSNEFVLLKLGELKSEVSNYLSSNESAIKNQQAITRSEYQTMVRLKEAAEQRLTIGAIGNPKVKSYYQHLHNLISMLELKRAALAKAQESYFAEVDKVQSNFNVPTSEFKAIETPLQVLLEEESLKDRLEFTLDFFKDVSSEFKNLEVEPHLQSDAPDEGQ